MICLQKTVLCHLFSIFPVVQDLYRDGEDQVLVFFDEHGISRNISVGYPVDVMTVILELHLEFRRWLVNRVTLTRYLFSDTGMNRQYKSKHFAPIADGYDNEFQEFYKFVKETDKFHGF